MSSAHLFLQTEQHLQSDSLLLFTSSLYGQVCGSISISRQWQRDSNSFCFCQFISHSIAMLNPKVKLFGRNVILFDKSIIALLISFSVGFIVFYCLSVSYSSFDYAKIFFRLSIRSFSILFCSAIALALPFLWW